MRPVDPRLLRRSRAARRVLLLAVLLGAVGTALVVGQAIGVAAVVAAAFEGRTVVAVVVAVAACLLGRGLVEWALAVVAARAASAVKAELRDDLVAATLDPHRRGDLPTTSRLATLVDAGLDPLDGYVGRFLPQLVLAVLTPAVVLAVLVVVDPLSALVVGLTLPLVVMFLVLVGLATRDSTDRRWQELARLGQHFAEVLRGLTLFAVLGRDQEKGLRITGQQHRRETMRALRMAFTSALVLELFSTLSVALVAVAIGLRVVHGDLTLHTGLVALLVAPEAYLPLRRLGAQYHDATAGVEAAQEALDLLEHGRAGGSVLTPARPVIEVDGLVVTYPGRTTPALQVSAVVVPGELVAVTGPSGCGKSSLLAVLLGFVAPAGGEVRVGGVPLGSLDVEDWRRHIAWVPQVPALLSGTVADNVRLGAPGASDDAVREALAAAGAADLEPSRPVGEGGDAVSSGERRRVGIARALLRVRHADASILLVDEPTAGLDAEREHRVLASLTGLRTRGGERVTTILVAHRPEAVAAADRELRLARPLVAA